ncbi:MAG: RidA family protein [Calditrichaceae bacterium]
MTSSKSTIKKDDFIIYINHIGYQNLYLTASVTDKPKELKKTVKDIYNELTKILLESDMQIVHERLFGNVSVQNEVTESRQRVMDEAGINDDLPLTYIEGQPCWGVGFSGLQIRAVHPEGSDENVWTIYNNEMACGRGWKQNGNTFLMLQNIYGTETSYYNNDLRKSQTKHMLDRIETLLKAQGAEYKNVVRTWIYLADILDWYDHFNEVRNEKYKQLKMLPDSNNGYLAEDIYMPASTGIEGNNPMQSAGVMDVLAVIPHEDFKREVRQTAGVKQKSPYRYKSAFSRATSVYDKGVKHVLVSGTAAIDDKGISMHENDTRAQIIKTAEVVENLVKAEGATMQDIYEATVFLKYAKDLPLYKKVAKEIGLSEIPQVIMVADVCRDELLFEMDASVAIDNPQN